MDYLTIKGTNLRITAAIDAYARKKIDHLEKFLQPIGRPKDVFVEIQKTTMHRKKGPYFRCEVDIRLPKKILRAEATAFDLYAAIDLVKDELERQGRAYRDKGKTKMLRGARAATEMIRLDPAVLKPGEALLSPRGRRKN